MTTYLFLVALLMVALLLVGAFMANCYKKVKEQGTVFVVNGFKDIRIVTTGGFIWPRINSYEVLDITRKKIKLERIGSKDRKGEESEGLSCKDNIRADIRVDFYIGLNPDPEELKSVVKNFKVERINDINVLRDYFTPKFSDGLKNVAKQFNFDELFSNRSGFRDEIIKVIGQDLDGFVLVDVVIDHIEQSKLDSLDPDNVMDSEGIRKIRETTAKRRIETNLITQEEETKLKKDTVDAVAKRLELQKQEEESKSKVEREIRTIKATENAIAKQTEEEQRLISEKAKIKTDEELAIDNENKEREIRIAQINNERITEIENEKVQRVKKTEAVKTETEVAIQEMEMQKSVESEKKEVAEITSQRVQIERKTAKEEEETMNLRVSSEAERRKLVMVKDAEGKAESDLVVRIKESEASKKVAEFDSETITIRANAKLVESEKESIAKVKLAEGIKAETAAQGLATVMVQDAEVEVLKKRGSVEAEVELKKSESLRATGKAQAANEEDMGVAKANAAKANYEAMNAIPDETREHEKYKLQLEKDRDVEMAGIKANVEVAERNAHVLSEALKSANIDIIGGETQIFEKIINAVGNSKAIDSRFNNSEILNLLVKDYRSGEKDLSKDIKEILQSSEISTGDLANISLAQLLSSPENMMKLKGLLDLTK